MQKTLIIDAHVHIYPNFDVTRAVRHSLNSSAAFAEKNRVPIWLLTERTDCDFFRRAESHAANGLFFEKQEETLLTVKNELNETILYIFAGRQIVSSDNLEVCALCTNFSQADKKRNTLDTIHAVREEGGIAALNWAPGKWFGDRGTVVQQIFEHMSPEELFISDTTMRPTIWPTPRLMAAAQKHGFRVLSGSDPLPFDGEETVISTYATKAVAHFDEEHPTDSLLSILNDPAQHFAAVGRRSGPLTFLQRQKKIMAEKKR